MKCECGSPIDTIDQMKEHRRLCQRPVARTTDLLSLSYSSHGDFSFTVPAEKFEYFIDGATDSREKLANYLQALSEKVRHCEYPFQTTAKEEHGPVDWT